MELDRVPNQIDLNVLIARLRLELTRIDQAIVTLKRMALARRAGARRHGRRRIGGIDRAPRVHMTRGSCHRYTG